MSEQWAGRQTARGHHNALASTSTHLLSRFVTLSANSLVSYMANLNFSCIQCFFYVDKYFRTPLLLLHATIDFLQSMRHGRTSLLLIKWNRLKISYKIRLIEALLFSILRSICTNDLHVLGLGHLGLWETMQLVRNGSKSLKHNITVICTKDNNQLHWIVILLL